MMGMNPKQLKKMERQMKKMGMEMKGIDDVEEVIIRCADKEIIITNAEVSVMNVMGQETYQITGNSIEVEREVELVIPDEDIEMVASTAGVSAADAEEALRECGGDLAEAILKLNG